MVTICDPRPTPHHSVSHWSLAPWRFLSATVRHELVNLLIAKLYYPYFRKALKTSCTGRAYRPSGLRLDRCAKLNPLLQFRKPRWNTQAHNAAKHLICIGEMV